MVDELKTEMHLCMTNCPLTLAWDDTSHWGKTVTQHSGYLEEPEAEQV